MNTENLKQLLALSDDELREKITQVAVEVGASRMQIGFALRDMGRLRNLIAGLTDADIAKFVAKIGNEKAAFVAEKIKNGGL